MREKRSVFRWYGRAVRTDEARIKSIWQSKLTVNKLRGRARRKWIVWKIT